MAYLTLTLPPSWGAEESYDVGSNFESQLGDGYISTSSSVEPRVTWTIQAIDTKDNINAVSEFLSNRSGVESFYWSPNVEVLPLQLYFCTEWSITPVGFDTFNFSATFIKDIESPCSDLSDLIDINKIKSDITASKIFIDNIPTIDVNSLITNNSTPKEGNTWLHVFYTFATEAYFDFFKIQVVEPNGVKKDVLIKSGAGELNSYFYLYGSGSPNPWANFSYAFQKKGKYKIRFLHEKDSGFSVQNEIVAIDSVVIGNSSTRAGITTTYLSQGFEGGSIPSGWTNNWWQITQSPVYSGTNAVKSSLTSNDKNATASLEFEFEVFPETSFQPPLLISNNNLVTKQWHQESSIDIPWQAGTLYDQINLSMAFLNGYKLLDDQSWLDKSLTLAEAIESYYYNGNSTLPHWLINVRSPIGSIQTNQLFEIYSPGSYTVLPPSVTTLAVNQVTVKASWLPMLWELYDELYFITQNSIWQTRSNKIKTGFQSIINYSPNVVNSELFRSSITLQDNTVTNRYGDWYLISQNLWGLIGTNTNQLLAAIDNLTKAQIKYAEINDDFGPFAFRISPGNSIWNLNTVTGNLSSTSAILFYNSIVDPMIEGSDSGFSQAQFGLWLAKALYYSNTKFDSLQEMLMNWLNWIDGKWCSIEPDFPPTRFLEKNTPYPDSDPATQALIGESALWANLNGEDAGATFRLILRSYEYLQKQFEANVTNVMYGSWSKDSEVYIGESLKNYDSRTHSCVINFLTRLALYKNQLTYPSCTESIRTPLLQQTMDSCCGSPTIPCGIYGIGNNITTEQNGYFNNCVMLLYMDLVDLS